MPSVYGVKHGLKYDSSGKDKTKETCQPDIGQQSDMDKEGSSIPLASFDRNEAWVKEYIEQFGTEPSFF